MAMLARQVYSAALWLLTPWVLARYWWRGRREPLYRQSLMRRLGWYQRAAQPVDVWLHAVSLGETLAVAPLLSELRAQYPGLRLLLTHGTATGREAGAKLLAAPDQQDWLPIDTPGAVRRFLAHYRPRVGVVMETEVWPNLLHQARRRGLPMVLANARLSERSLAKGQRLPALMRPALAAFTLVLAQTEADRERLLQGGAAHASVMGNLKFDITPATRAVARGVQWRQALARPVVLAAVTREGEEQTLFQAWAALPGQRPLLVVVPRHPQRFDEVLALATSAGLSVRRRSSWTDQPPEQAATADVWLGDSLGEMATYYGLADVALLGGSFAPLGGQNLIEAAACGCPLVMGPHTFNFAQAALMSLQAGASVRVASLDEGVRRALALASDQQRNRWVQRALAFATAHRGAAQRMAGSILALLGAPA